MESATTPSLTTSLEIPLVKTRLVAQGPAGVVAVVNENENENDTTESLPQFFILQSNKTDIYLHYNDTNAEMPADALQFDGDYTVSLKTRFEFEPASTGGGLYHIRSMYNNKYWSRVQSDDGWITASASKTDEDKSACSCTLFQPEFENPGDNGKVRFRHVNSGKYVYHGKNEFIRAVDTSSSCGTFSIIDWESIVMFPNRIVIKGINGLYLRTRDDGYLEFSRGNREINEDLEYEVIPSRNGGIRLRSVHFDKHWRSTEPGKKAGGNKGWVLANLHYAPTDQCSETVFLPIRLDNNDIALRSLSTNFYCQRYTYSEKMNYLAAVTSCIENDARMVIGEPVLSRKISNVNYRLSDARISDEKVLMIMNQEVINKTKETNTVVLDIKYTYTQASTWNSSHSISLGVKTEISTDVPFMVNGSIEFSGEFKRSYQWGEIIEKNIEVESTFTVPVPPMSRVEASSMVSEASFDIPYSYTLHDVLTNGTTKVYESDDGWYTGFNSFNFRYQTKQFPLDDPAS